MVEEHNRSDAIFTFGRPPVKLTIHHRETFAGRRLIDETCSIFINGSQQCTIWRPMGIDHRTAIPGDLEFFATRLHVNDAGFGFALRDDDSLPIGCESYPCRTAEVIPLSNLHHTDWQLGQVYP